MIQKVIIADDSKEFRKALLKLLKGIYGLALKGINKEQGVIEESKNDSGLLQKIRTNRPEILFIDIEMPYSKGFGTIKAISSLYPDIKIIGMSSHKKDELVHRLIDIGAKGYLVKSGDNYETIKKILSGEYDDFLCSPEINCHKPVLQPEKIILAVDNPDDKNLHIIHYMRKAGYKVLSAKNITETTFFFNENRVDGLIIQPEVLLKNSKFIDRVLRINKNPNLKIFIVTRNQQRSAVAQIDSVVEIHELEYGFRPEMIIEKLENI